MGQYTHTIRSEELYQRKDYLKNTRKSTREQYLLLRIIGEERENKRLHDYCETYSNGILLCLGRRFSIMRRADSILLSPSSKARIDPMIIPPMPPTAMPSRNLRLRNTVIVDVLFLLDNDDG